MSVPPIPKGTILVVSKCPIPGSSKTRLIPLLGAEGAAALAKAMLSDVLLTLQQCEEFQTVQKVLLFAPGTREGRIHMCHILEELNIPYHVSEENESNTNHAIAPFPRDARTWTLLPLRAGTSSTGESSREKLKSSDLGDLLQQALEDVQDRMEATKRQQYSDYNNINSGGGGETSAGGNARDEDGSIVFLGMDSPILPLDDIATGLCTRVSDSMGRTAILCPAEDGGYGMLSIPWSLGRSQAASSRGEAGNQQGDRPHRELPFDNVLWSHPLTAVSQMKALTDMGVTVRLGQGMHDMDEPHDVLHLCDRLRSCSGGDDTKESKDFGQNSSWHIPLSTLDTPVGGGTASIASGHPVCLYTRQALQQAGLL